MAPTQWLAQRARAAWSRSAWPITATTTTTMTTTTATTSRHISTLALQQLESLRRVFRRDGMVAISATYGDMNDSLSPGAIVGIILGSVFGFLLLVWLCYTCFSVGEPWPVFGFVGATNASVSSVVVRERIGRSRRSRVSRSQTTKSHASRAAPAARRVVKETVEVRRERSPRPPPPRAPPPPDLDEIIVEEEVRSRPPRVVPVDVDEVVVIEEHSPSRRSRSRRPSPLPERESGYRRVDPLAYGGGDEPLRDIGRRSSRSSHHR